MSCACSERKSAGGMLADAVEAFLEGIGYAGWKDSVYTVKALRKSDNACGVGEHLGTNNFGALGESLTAFREASRKEGYVVPKKEIGPALTALQDFLDVGHAHLSISHGECRLTVDHSDVNLLPAESTPETVIDDIYALIKDETPLEALDRLVEDYFLDPDEVEVIREALEKAKDR